ncbi:MAG: DNA polymerase Y family protein [Shinella sp.]|nr:DNA polymerase Y family protein [Shinella sp.]
MQIARLDSTAEKASLRRGLAIAEARAICPGVDVLPLDNGADRVFLGAIADWCGRYTPLVALDRHDDGLLLDITGCAHLHGGERAMLDDLLSRLFHMGVEARGAISSTVGLAWAAARFSRPDIVIAQGEEARVLAPMPVAALRIDIEANQALNRVGLKRIGDLLSAPRAPITQRFGPEPLLRLDQALGFEKEALSPRLPVPGISSERRLAEPVVTHEDILALAAQLARGVKTGLEKRGEGGRLFQLLLFRVDGRVFSVEAGTSAPLRNPERVAELFRERMESFHDDLDAGFGFETIRLCVLKAERMHDEQADFAGDPDAERPLSAFLDRVTARLGPGSLLMPVFAESHMPERAAVFRPVDNLAQLAPEPVAPAMAPSAEFLPGARPLRLLSPPEPIEATAEVPEGAPKSFHWRRAFHRTKKAEGPERIAAEWWIDGEDAPTRDYYRLEDEMGRRYWLFREGLYGREQGHPRWFLHGIFA